MEYVMTVFFLIIMTAILLQLAAKTGLNPLVRFRDNARAATAFAFIFIGATHFAMPEKYLEMMPPFLPAPVFLIYLSGVFEILGGVGLMLSRTKRLAAMGLILLLLAVFPANIYVALNSVQLGGYMNYAVYQWLRLPMQFVLMAWVWWCAAQSNLWRENYEG
jgi:uncharacterized membrane protein